MSAWDLASSALNTGFGLYQSNRDWQKREHFARHQYQWAVQDMKQAGLNPILAATGGLKPGSAPGGGPIIESKVDLAALKKMAAETDLLREKKKTETTIRQKAQAEATNTGWQSNQIMNYLSKEFPKRVQQISEQTELIRKQKGVQDAEAYIRQQQKKILEDMEVHIGDASGLAPAVGKLIMIMLGSQLGGK